jgi:hypothetical protein
MIMRITLLFAFLFFLFWNCKKEENVIVKENPPTVMTKVASDVTLKNATLNGEVTDEGFTATTDRGFVLSDKNTNPSVSDTKIQSGYGKGVYSIVLDKLPVNTKYYFKSYATNTKGTSYGEVESFTTADYKLPTIVTEVPKNITYTTVQLTGTVSDDGGTGVTERGFCLSTTTLPTISNIKIENGSGLGVYTTVVTQLKEETIYYIRAYATNSKGTSYSNEVSFKTLAYLTPTVITGSPSSIGVDIATLNGEVTNAGGTDLIEKGFLVSTNPNVGFSDRKVVSSSKEVGKFAIVLTNLKANTKYYFRAFSINIKGSTLGVENSFTTEQAKSPTVSTNDFDQITETSVHTGLGIDNDGGSPISEYGVCISASNPNPSTSDRKIVFGNSVTNFPFGEMQVIAGLTKSTTYYVRGYAINSIGVAYGKSNSFSTLTPAPATPAPVTPAPVTPAPATPAPSTPTPPAPPAPPTPAATLKNGLVAYYPFNGNANDVSGNNLNGILTNTSITTNRFSINNSAYLFNNSDIYIPFNNKFRLTNLTTSAWIRPSSYTPDNYSIILNRFEEGYNTIGGETWQVILTNNEVWFQVIGEGRSGTAPYTILKASKQIQLNDWSLITSTYDGTYMKVYVNGSLLLSQPTTTKINTLGTSGISIGVSKQANGIWHYFDGKIDDVGIWERALTAEEIKFLFENDFKP